MKHIGSNRPLMLAQSRMRREIVTLFKGAAAQARIMLLTLADGSGKIQSQSAQRMAVTRVGQIVSDLFTGADNRSAFGDDGVTALAPYPRILNTWIAWSTFQAVKQEESWLRAHTPEDVFQFLRGGKHKIISEIAPEDLFRPNPLAEIDPNRAWVPAHKWTDERGYRLSDRVWRSDLETRRKIDELLIRGLREGRSALDLASALEAYLVPGREGIRTLKPYGSRFQPGGASADAMRLARTEVARAFNQAAWVSAYMNPYVGGIDIARSANGDPSCPICPMHATIGLYGERLRDPYPLTTADVGPFHPHCLCYVLPAVTDNPAAVTERLRAMMADAQAELDINPADAWMFTAMLLDPILMDLLRQLGLSPQQPILF
jgi:hypothetical protein